MYCIIVKVLPVATVLQYEYSTRVVRVWTVLHCTVLLLMYCTVKAECLVIVLCIALLLLYRTYERTNSTYMYSTLCLLQASIATVLCYSILCDGTVLLYTTVLKLLVQYYCKYGPMSYCTTVLFILKNWRIALFCSWSSMSHRMLYTVLVCTVRYCCTARVLLYCRSTRTRCTILQYCR